MKNALPQMVHYEKIIFGLKQKNKKKLEKINSSKSVNSKKSSNILRSKKVYRLKMSQNIRNIFYIYFPTPEDIIQAQIKINIESAKI